MTVCAAVHWFDIPAFFKEVTITSYSKDLLKRGNKLMYTRFVDAFVSSGLSQWVTESTFFRSGIILDFVFTSAFDRIGDVNIHCLPRCGDCPIVFVYVFDFSY